MKMALEPATNPGFVREDAALALVFITDEDDCSAEDTDIFDLQNLSFGPTNWRCFEAGVQCAEESPDTLRAPGPRTDCIAREHEGPLHSLQRYVETLRQTKPAGDVIVSVIAGPAGPVAVELANGVGPAGEAGPELRPSCSGISESDDGSQQAFPAIRLQAFAERAAPERHTFTSICANDLTPALDHIGELVRQAPPLGWCLPFDPADADPTTSIPEGDCRVDWEGEPLPACEVTPTKPCYELLHRPSCPKSDSALALRNITAQTFPEQLNLTCWAR
jgi:hypothetical protein